MRTDRKATRQNVNVLTLALRNTLTGAMISD